MPVTGLSRLRRDLVRRLRIALVVASALVVGLTGSTWALYREVTAGITTTDVITGGRDSGPQNILLVGIDSRTDAQGKPLPLEIQRVLRSGPDTGVLNSDTIMLLHVPEDGGAAVAFSIPRDSYVDIPGYRSDKINAAYPASKAQAAEELVADGELDPGQVEAQSARAGRSALIRTVESLTGVEIDHYAEINLLGFYNLTRAIGGVEVCLNAAVNEELSGARFRAGPQLISGGDALAFVRQRHELPEGDLSRIRRQQVFLAAVADRITSAGTLTNPEALSALVGVAEQSLVIDDDWDLLGFAQQAADIAAGNLTFRTIPTRGTQSNARGDVVLVDPSEVRDFVEQRIEEAQAADAEQEPEHDAEPAPAPTPAPTEPSRYELQVRNATGTTGLAARVAARLSELGFGPITVDNTTSSPTSAVLHADSDADGARAVAAQLGGIPVKADARMTPGDIQVVLGADFGPSVPTPAPASTVARTPAPDSDPVAAAGVPCID
ncbi:MAG: LCP family protein [Pseudonocardia sp.]